MTAHRRLVISTFERNLTLSTCTNIFVHRTGEKGLLRGSQFRPPLCLALCIHAALAKCRYGPQYRGASEAAQWHPNQFTAHSPDLESAQWRDSTSVPSPCACVLRWYTFSIAIDPERQVRYLDWTIRLSLVPHPGRKPVRCHGGHQHCRSAHSVREQAPSLRRTPSSFLELLGCRRKR
jgi:hypothetical protein